MYDELVERLRAESYTLEELSIILPKAADAIEELSRENESLAKSVNEASEMLRKRWIPVTERLPEDGAAVNVTWVNHSPSIYYQHLKDKPQTATGVYYRRKWYWWSNVVQDYLAEYGEWGFDEMDDAIEVTHWMPLPEPPKEETK